MSLEVLSTELQQAIIGYLDFFSLLALKNTSIYWRGLVNISLSKPGIILPARIKLLHLYQELHLYPSFLKRELPEILPFSRVEYLSTLKRQISECAPNSGIRIPTEFELWILEWPEHAVIGYTWPGVEESGKNMLHIVDAGERLCWTSDTELAGLLVEDYECTNYCTLFFDCGEEKYGMVWNGDICQLAEIEDWEEDDDLAGCWTDWLRNELGTGEGYF